MSEVKQRGKILGWCGVLCLAIFWTVRFAPETGDAIFGVSSLGKFVALGIFLAAALLPIIAGIRGSRWWLVVAAVSLATLIDFYIRLSRVVR
jgi:hypothetical protein